MCVNFRPPDPEMLDAVMGVIIDLHDTGFWAAEAYKDYAAPIVRRRADGKREGLLANYAMYPMKFQKQDYEKKKVKAQERGEAVPKPKWFDTMNARSETVGSGPMYRGSWAKHQRCLVPLTAFYEPCYETGKSVRWSIGMADQAMFAVAGIWREWAGPNGPECAFTQLTINADDHELMRRFHRPEDEKRSLVIVPQGEWDEWLSCNDTEFARSFLRHYPAELMTSWAAPATTRKPKGEQQLSAEPAPIQLGLL
jgi:putative SOS response-associated peptidase YedK